MYCNVRTYVGMACNENDDVIFNDVHFWRRTSVNAKHTAFLAARLITNSIPTSHPINHKKVHVF